MPARRNATKSSHPNKKKKKKQMRKKRPNPAKLHMRTRQQQKSCMKELKSLVKVCVEERKEQGFTKGDLSNAIEEKVKTHIPNEDILARIVEKEMMKQLQHGWLSYSSETGLYRQQQFPVEITKMCELFVNRERNSVIKSKSYEVSIRSYTSYSLFEPEKLLKCWLKEFLCSHTKDQLKNIVVGFVCTTGEFGVRVVEVLFHRIVGMRELLEPDGEHSDDIIQHKCIGSPCEQLPFDVDASYKKRLQTFETATWRTNIRKYCPAKFGDVSAAMQDHLQSKFETDKAVVIHQKDRNHKTVFKLPGTGELKALKLMFKTTQQSSQANPPITKMKQFEIRLPFPQIELSPEVARDVKGALNKISTASIPNFCRVAAKIARKDMPGFLTGAKQCSELAHQMGVMTVEDFPG